jgi:hypothetical protein
MNEERISIAFERNTRDKANIREILTKDAIAECEKNSIRITKIIMGIFHNVHLHKSPIY